MTTVPRTIPFEPTQDSRSGEWTGANGHDRYESREEAIISPALDICGCGRVDCRNALLPKMLKAIAEGTAPAEVFEAAVRDDCELVSEILMHWFESLDLMDHGTNVYGSWPTEEGFRMAQDVFADGVISERKRPHLAAPMKDAFAAMLVRSDEALPKYFTTFETWARAHPSDAGKLLMAFLAERAIINPELTGGHLTDIGRQIAGLAPSTEDASSVDEATADGDASKDENGA